MTSISLYYNSVLLSLVFQVVVLPSKKRSQILIFSKLNTSPIRISQHEFGNFLFTKYFYSSISYIIKYLYQLEFSKSSFLDTLFFTIKLCAWKLFFIYIFNCEIKIEHIWRSKVKFRLLGDRESCSSPRTIQNLLITHQNKRNYQRCRR